MPTEPAGPDQNASAANAAPLAGKRPAPPCTLVIFGAGGDLTKRLLMPALYNLSADGLLDDGMRIVGVNHGERETAEWRTELTDVAARLRRRPREHVPTSQLDEKSWDWVAERLQYFAGRVRIRRRRSKASSNCSRRRRAATWSSTSR